MPVILPGYGGAAGNADHQDRSAYYALLRPHVTVTEVGIAFQTDKPPGSYGELAAAAEVYGFDVVSVCAALLYQPPLPALLEMARATSRVRLGAACLNPYTQHPYEIAGWLAALDAASGGRAYLGLARGTWLEAISVARWPTCATPRRSCARCCPATTAATTVPPTGWPPGSGSATGCPARL